MLRMYWRPSGRVGCWLPLIGLAFILFGSIFLAIAGQQILQEQGYKSGQCTITAKQLLHEVSVSTNANNNGNGNTTYTTTSSDLYAPSFEYTLHAADGRSAIASGYDGSDTYTSDRTGQQAVVDRYTLGQNYQCWYNPKDLTQTVLVRQPDWIFIIIGGIFALLGVILAIIGILSLAGVFGARRPS